MRTSAAAALLTALTMVGAGCSSGSDDSAPMVRAGPGTTSALVTTTTTEPVTATTPAPGPTTTGLPAGSARGIRRPVVTAPQAPAGPARVVISPRGIPMTVLDKLAEGFRVRTPCGNVTTIPGGTPVSGAVVVLDPGHGGAEPGAVGPNGQSEAPVNLAVVNFAKAALERAGVSVVSTRTGEYEMGLTPRTEMVKALSPQAFVSVHHNAEPDEAWPRPGTETYYQIGSATSKRLSGLVYEEVLRALSAYPGPWVADRDAGAKYRQGANGDFYAVLRQTAGVTSVLAELAFISNPPEAELIRRPDVQQVEGEAVARGILRYLTTSDPGSGFTEPYPRPAPPGGGGGGGRRCQDPPL